MSWVKNIHNYKREGDEVDHVIHTLEPLLDSSIKPQGRDNGWAFDPSVAQLVEEITVKLHLTGKSRLTF